jgi:hypothetical protein
MTCRVIPSYRLSLRTTIFPVFGLASATVNLVVLALGARVLSTTALGWLLLLHGLFMGTVMGVVQVTVQSASGPRRLLTSPPAVAAPAVAGQSARSVATHNGMHRRRGYAGRGDHVHCPVCRTCRAHGSAATLWAGHGEGLATLFTAPIGAQGR